MLPAAGEQYVSERSPKSYMTEYQHLQDRTGASDIKHLCVHTIGSFGLFGLGHSFHVPSSLNRDPSRLANTLTAGSRTGRETTQI